VDELARAQVDPHMGLWQAEEHQVSGLQLLAWHRAEPAELLFSGARHHNASSGESPLHQPAAIEPGRVYTAQTVRHAQLRQRSGSDWRRGYR